MKTIQAIEVLRDYNLWRRSDEDMEQPDPREIGRAIDTAIESMEALSEWRTLMSWGGTPEIINDFIKGQQSRIYAAQDAEEQRDRLAEALRELCETLLKDQPRDITDPLNKAGDALAAWKEARSERR